MCEIKIDIFEKEITNLLGDKSSEIKKKFALHCINTQARNKNYSRSLKDFLKSGNLNNQDFTEIDKEISSLIDECREKSENQKNSCQHTIHNFNGSLEQHPFKSFDYKRILDAECKMLTALKQLVFEIYYEEAILAYVPAYFSLILFKYSQYENVYNLKCEILNVIE